jgi:hypothetical protein
MFEHGVLTKLLFQNNRVNVIRSFPGTLPVSLSRHALTNVLPFGYVFSIKADGYRSFLILLQDFATGLKHVYLYKRDESITVVHSDIKESDSIEDLQELMALPSMHLTILDVEVLDSQLLVFDVLCLNNQNVVNMSYERRHASIVKWIEKSEASEVADKKTSSAWLPLSSLTMESIHTMRIGKYDVFAKPIFATRDFTKVWASYCKSLGELEGVIFYRLLKMYSPFRCDDTAVLKWKVLGRITLDFLVDSRVPLPGSTVTLSTVFGVSETFTTQTKGNVILISTPLGSQSPMRVAYGFVPSHQMEAVDQKIAEFVFVEGVWQFHMLRADKKKPNNIATVVATIKNIEENISDSDLGEFLSNPSRKG